MAFDVGEAENNPLLNEFVSLVDQTTSDGIPSFKDIQAAPFMKFWKNFMIYRYEENLDDFRVVLYGTHLAENSGFDCTGLVMSDMGFGTAEDMIRNMNKEVIKTGERIYATNSLYWQNKEHRVFHQIRMPLRRSDCVKEVLVCMTFG